MVWFEILAVSIILGGVAFYCWAVYGRRSGPTGCIGCGKCVADGVCILTGKKVPKISGNTREPCDFPVDNRAETVIMNVSENEAQHRKMP